MWVNFFMNFLVNDLIATVHSVNTRNKFDLGRLISQPLMLSSYLSDRPFVLVPETVFKTFFIQIDVS